MKKELVYFFSIFLALNMLQSCSSYKQTVQTESGTHIKKIKLHNVWVFKTNKTKVKGILYSANLDGVTIAKDQNFNETEFITIRPSDIELIKINKKGQLGRSALVGSLAGAGIGAVIGYSRGDDEDTIIFTMTKEDKAAINGLIFGVIGGAAGLMMGTSKKKIEIEGDRQKYESNLGFIESHSVVWKY